MEEQPKRIVDTQTFLPVLIDLVREGHTVALTITGHSMTPFWSTDGIRSASAVRTTR